MSNTLFRGRQQTPERSLGSVSGLLFPDARNIRQVTHERRGAMNAQPRYTPLLFVCVLVASVARPQGAELIPAPYLAPKYLAPPGAPSNTVIAGRSEPGDRLIVTGRALDQGQPVAGVSIYAFHADVYGLYQGRPQ
jgi:hypothetical protein